MHSPLAEKGTTNNFKRLSYHYASLNMFPCAEEDLKNPGDKDEDKRLVLSGHCFFPALLPDLMTNCVTF